MNLPLPGSEGPGLFESGPRSLQGSSGVPGDVRAGGDAGETTVKRNTFKNPTDWMWDHWDVRTPL